MTDQSAQTNPAAPHTPLHPTPHLTPCILPAADAGAQTRWAGPRESSARPAKQRDGALKQGMRPGSHRTDVSRCSPPGGPANSSTVPCYQLDTILKTCGGRPPHTNQLLQPPYTALRSSGLPPRHWPKSNQLGGGKAVVSACLEVSRLKPVGVAAPRLQVLLRQLDELEGVGVHVPAQVACAPRLMLGAAHQQQQWLRPQRQL